MSDTLALMLGILLGVGTLVYLLSGGTMKLSAAQIAVFAQNAGFTGSDLATAVAIALAESGGDPNSRGDKTAAYPLGTSYGLWQIHWTVHPEVGDPNNLFDPQTNANAAFQVFQEQGFNAWSTYGNLPGHNNAYLAYVQQAQDAINATGETQA